MAICQPAFGFGRLSHPGGCEPSDSLKPMCLETISVRQAAEALDRLLDRN